MGSNHSHPKYGWFCSTLKLLVRSSTLIVDRNIHLQLCKISQSCSSLTSKSKPGWLYSFIISSSHHWSSNFLYFLAVCWNTNFLRNFEAIRFRNSIITADPYYSAKAFSFYLVICSSIEESVSFFSNRRISDFETPILILIR